MRIAREGWPYVLGSLVLFGGAGWLALPSSAALAAVCWSAGLALAGVMVHFFRDPERTPPAGDDLILAGADGTIRAVEVLREDRHLGIEAVRVSTYLSLLDVHINRCPLAGEVTVLGYERGRHLLTTLEASAHENQHSTVVLAGATTCLVKQIVGPLVRRIVTWLEPGQQVGRGERLGLMKFGSRLDVYLPRDAVEVLVEPGQHVTAGVTPIARLRTQHAAK